MLGLDLMTSANVYPAWFSGWAGYLLVVIEIC